MTQVASFLGSHLHTVLDLAQHYVEISAGIQARVLADFEKYGVTIADFKVLSISPPDHVQEMIDKRGGMAAVGSLDKFVQYQAGNALEKSAQGGGGGGLAAARASAPARASGSARAWPASSRARSAGGPAQPASHAVPRAATRPSRPARTSARPAARASARRP